MRHLALATALLLSTPVMARAQDGLDGSPVRAGAATTPLVAIDNFGTVTLDIDFHGQDPHVATESFWLRRSDDGDPKHKVLEQFSARHGRWKDSAKTQAFVPSTAYHDQFDTDAIAFTGDFFRELNRALAAGDLSRSAKLAAAEGDEVSFKLSWNPKGHLAKGLNDPVTFEGRLSRGADGRLSFSPADEAGKKVQPLLDLLLAQRDATNRAQDETRSAVLLFGKVDASGALSLTDTSWSCSLEGARGDTASHAYRVSGDTEPSLRDLVAKQTGKMVIVRAVLSEPDAKHADATAKVVGVMSTIGWKEPILNAPGGDREFANGGTLANLTDDEARELVGGPAGKGQVAAEVTSIDPKTGFATIRAPNRKGSTRPNAGFVKEHSVNVLTADPRSESYGSKPLDEILGAPSATPGVDGRLGAVR